MKNLLKALVAAAIIIPLLSSCNKGSDGDYPQYGDFVTVGVEPSDLYYFTLDNNKKVYPSDVSRIPTYSTKDKTGASKNGNRAFIYYSILDGKAVEGYHYSAALYYEIVDIQSKSVDTLGAGDVADDKFGDDKLTMESARITNGWLDIGYVLKASPDSKHKMTLLINPDNAPAEVPVGYQYFEFRQQAESLSGSQYTGKGNVSYRLGKYDPAITGKKGLYIRVNNINGGVKYEKLDYQVLKPSTSSAPKSSAKKVTQNIVAY